MVLIRKIAPLLLSLVPLALGSTFLYMAVTDTLDTPVRIVLLLLALVLLAIAYAILHFNYFTASDPARVSRPSATKSASSEQVELSPEFDLDSIENAWPVLEGYVRPKWDAIYEYIDKTLPEPQRPHGLNLAVQKWLAQIARSMGDDYRIYENKEFFLVTNQPLDAAKSLLKFCTNTEREVLQMFKLPPNPPDAWKLPVILFDGSDPYYQYTAHYYGEGAEFAGSGGVFLTNSGYPHIAAPDRDRASLIATLTHELIHACLHSYDLPLWLEEGMIRVVERKNGQFGNEPIVDQEELRQHKRLWTPVTIQQFWSGESFSRPDPWSKLSYSLSEIIVNVLLTERRSDFPDFIAEAAYEDAGEAAAQECFGFGVGDALATFLGDGDWAPRGSADAARETGTNSVTS